MAHHISAVILKGLFNREAVQTLDWPSIPLTGELTLFLLDAAFVNHWAVQLGSDAGFAERPSLDCHVVHAMVQRIAPESLFAVIETEYFGGTGDQAAAVYQGDRVVLAPMVGVSGPINEALRCLGIRPSADKDEFDTVGLDRFRRFDKMFPSTTRD
jgi:hypothetical protein